MSYGAGPIASQFVHPGDAVPASTGFQPPQPNQSGAHYPGRRSATRRAGRGRRPGKSRHILPVLIALAAALVFATLTEGGRSARTAAPVSAYLDQMLERVGLGLTEVTINGQRRTTDREISARLQLADVRSVWLFDTESARRRIETLPWVLKASLKRVFPDRLHVDIQERVPHAVWNDGKRPLLIDVTGRVLGLATKDRSGGLPNIFGAGAASHVSAILDEANRMPALRGKITLFEWTANRRWTLHLTGRRRVLMPATGLSLALVRLTRGKRGERLIDGNFEMLDLRIAGQTAVDFRS